ncbi:hypothetical protein DIPPA_16669 [Diplonema papillatum]|nr:hypothetical protein DIPPA_16669 [Diplonema papillatum]
MDNLALFWGGREAALRGPGMGPVFEELEPLEGFHREDAEIHYGAIRREADRRWAAAGEGEMAKRRRVLHVVVYEAWATGMHDEPPEMFVTLVDKLFASGHSSLLELAVVEGKDNMPTTVHVRFRTAAKKWYGCHAARERNETAREEDKRRSRRPGEARDELVVQERLHEFGLTSLPSVLVPLRATLNAYQAVVEANPALALPYVDVGKAPYTPKRSDWRVDGALDAVQRVLVLQKYMVVASLAGCFGSQPWPVILGYPAVVAGIAARLGEGMAAEYDDKLRLLFAEEPRAAEGTVFLQAAKAMLLEVYPGVLNELYWRKIDEARAPGGEHHRDPGRRERGEVTARTAPPPQPPVNPRQMQNQQRLRRAGARTRQDEEPAKRSKPNG